jgi:hypothetical protein
LSLKSIHDELSLQNKKKNFYQMHKVNLIRRKTSDLSSISNERLVQMYEYLFF